MNIITPNVVAITHAHGLIGYMRMLKPVDVSHFVELGLMTSIQPQRTMDDRDVITCFWTSPTGVPYPLRALHDAGIALRTGSGVSVAPPDPRLAIPAVVLDAESSGREPFQSGQYLDVHTPLIASTATGHDRLAFGDSTDMVLLDADPCAADTPEAMYAMPQHVVMTSLCRECTY